MKKKGKIMKLGIILGSILLICVLSIGIFPLGIQTVSATYLAESYHPYANNYENTWTISELGVAEMRLHFTKIEFGSHYDYIYILDKNDRQLTSYGSSGGFYDNYEDVWTEWYTGDTLKVKLKTNSQGTAFGFIVDKKETRGTVPTPEQTPSPIPITPTPASPAPTPIPSPTSPTPTPSPTRLPTLKTGEPYVCPSIRA